MEKMKFVKGNYERLHRTHEEVQLFENEYALVYDLKNGYIANLYIGKSIIIDEDTKETTLKNIFVCTLDAQNAKNLSCEELKRLINDHSEDIKKEISEVIL